MAAWQMGRSFETDTPETLERAYQYDIPIPNIESEFGRVNYYIGRALTHLIRAAEYLDPTGGVNPIDDLIDKLDDGYRDEMRKVLKKLKEGA